MTGKVDIDEEAFVLSCLLKSVIRKVSSYPDVLKTCKLYLEEKTSPWQEDFPEAKNAKIRGESRKTLQ